MIYNMDEIFKRTPSSYNDIENGNTSSNINSLTEWFLKCVRTKLLNAIADNKRFCREEERIKSFNHRWPTLQSPQKFSGCGFYFTGEADLVRCYQCGVGLSNWLEDDTPLKEHVKHSPNCRFIQNTLSRPEPLANLIMLVIRRKFGGPIQSEQALDINLDIEDTELAVNRRLKKRRTCRICQQDGASRECMFLPCGHLLSCDQCAKEVRICPVPTCGNLVRKTMVVKLYPPFQSS